MRVFLGMDDGLWRSAGGSEEKVDEYERLCCPYPIAIQLAACTAPCYITGTRPAAMELLLGVVVVARGLNQPEWSKLAGKEPHSWRTTCHHLARER